MIQPFKWLDERTGLVTAWSKMTHWTVPASHCVCRFLPVAIVFAFLIQGLTGLFLWAFYSPSAQTAWESVYYIQYHLPFGWLLRGIHHYSAQLLVGMLGMYVLMLILHGSYRRPREFVYWSAVVMLLFALASCLTGDLLPWSLSGYYATSARVSFLQLLPGIGVPLYQLVVGGPDPQFGTLTLTRFTVLHIAVFGGGFLCVMLFWKWADIRSRALTQIKGEKHSCALACAVTKQRAFWSCEAVKCGLICLLFMVAVLLLVFQHSLCDKQISGHAVTVPPEFYLGAELTSPADPADSYEAARPEWSFRALYYMTKLPIFSVIGMIFAVFVIPAILGVYFFALPILGRCKVLHYLNVLIVFALFVVFCAFTYLSYYDDYKNPEHAETFAAGKEKADVLMKRAVELSFAPAGIPKSGALGLIQNDAYTQAPKIFVQQCSSCHNFEPFGDVAEVEDFKSINCPEPSAPNLYNCVSPNWIHGYQELDKVTTDDYFGKTAFGESGSMVGYLKGRVYGGLDTDDGMFVLNQNGLIYSLIAPDASPAFDILESAFEDLLADEENAEAIENGEYASLFKAAIAAKFEDEEFMAGLNPRIPQPVLEALKSVLMAMTEDGVYQELLADSDNISLIKDDEDYATFLTDTYLATLCGNDEPIAKEDLTYINRLRTGIQDSCREMGEVLYEESQLDDVRPLVDGEYAGLRANAIDDMKFLTCTECHAFYGVENDHACDLRGYMSKNWIKGIIADPGNVKYYGAKNDRMPAYHPAEGEKLLDERSIEMLADWLHGNWYRAPELKTGNIRFSEFFVPKDIAQTTARDAAEILYAELQKKTTAFNELKDKADQQLKERAEKAVEDEANAQLAMVEKLKKEKEEAQAALKELKESSAKELAEVKTASEQALANAKNAVQSEADRVLTEVRDSANKEISELRQKYEEAIAARDAALKTLAEKEAEANSSGNQSPEPAPEN